MHLNNRATMLKYRTPIWLTIAILSVSVATSLPVIHSPKTMSYPPVSVIKGYFKARIPFYMNSDATFTLPILTCSDVSPNPGPSATVGHKNISCLLCNSRSIRNKCQELEIYLKTTPADIICLTETWLSSNDLDSVLGFSDDYVIIRKDRHQGRRGGGVLAAVKTSLSPVRLPTPEPADDLELVWISIKLGSESFLLGLLYRPPSSSVAYWAKLGQAMETHNIDSFDGCLLLGDFNVDLTPSITGNHHRTRLLDIASDFNLEQLVQSFTRPSQNNPNSGSIIDLVFTN